ncbi:hypothetical protein O1611_g431 [Lasiodiplodia mahajangana]|uniref:Uncharacterized protein n=1 Tax=Lasiodiplodia mahajangana TaxID=1108764 RepID=A0ACC2K075_9PEZI|nr:hypothetical protein O1611_g431 [Lasiodiplodia mahajangana]
MKTQTVLRFYGLLAATGALSQGDDIPDLIADGPFALRVKGRACNSSIDGYLHTVDAPSYPEPSLLLHYDASPASIAENSSYRFYFNYTGRMESGDNELGFFVSDITVGEPNSVGLVGKAMSLQYRPNTNVAVPAFGVSASTVDLTGFDKEHKAFLDYYTDDATYAPNQPGNFSLDNNYYNWAICWQTYSAISGPTLSWITTGQPHNPTCELVDLLRSNL